MANSIDAVLAQYEKNSQPSGSPRQNISQEDRMKKYFSAILQKNEKSAQKRIRVLPTKDGSSPFVEVWYHEIQVNGQWVKLYDPDKNDNERSPLTEVYNELISTGKKEDKELASQYRSRLFYIVKVVDRDNEQDGVKFWRFKHNYKQEGVLDKILPTKDGSSPFVEVWYHEIQVNGQWVKLYDPDKNDNERSPLTEVYNELISTGKKEDKELASQYRSRLFYIVKVVDRDNEQDGVKFWRFKHNYKQEGVLDKILPIWKAKGDVTDSEKGRDLIIELTKAKTPQGKEYTVVQTIMYDDPSPVHEDKEIMEGWLQDELTWTDVYSKKPVEYLEAVAVGETPMWNSELKKYVYGEEAEISLGGTQKEETPIVDPQANDEPSEELPF